MSILCGLFCIPLLFSFLFSFSFSFPFPFLFLFLFLPLCSPLFPPSSAPTHIIVSLTHIPHLTHANPRSVHLVQPTLSTSSTSFPFLPLLFFSSTSPLLLSLCLLLYSTFYTSHITYHHHPQLHSSIAIGLKYCNFSTFTLHQPAHQPLQFVLCPFVTSFCVLLLRCIPHKQHTTYSSRTHTHWSNLTGRDTGIYIY